MENFPLAEISDHLAEPDTVVWLDMLDPDHEDLQTIVEEFGFHPLAVEDAMDDMQRPKLDHYEAYLFLNMYSVDFKGQNDGLRSSEISAFVTQRALITIRKDDRFPIDSVVERWDNTSQLAQYGVGFLLHGLIDFVIDGHFHAVQELDDVIEDLEEGLFEDKVQSRDTQRNAFQLRRNLVLLRRVVLPMREVVNSLMRRESQVVPEGMVPYYQDVYDHVLRASEWTDSLRDLVTSVFETNLNIQSNRLNEVMKKLTSWAAIIAVPTAITGFYGQNVPYPGFNQHWGFWVSSALMTALVVLLYGMFRRNEWL